jgi:hypothetical protein
VRTARNFPDILTFLPSPAVAMPALRSFGRVRAFCVRLSRKGKTPAQHRFRRRVGRYLAFRRQGFPAYLAWKYAGDNFSYSYNVSVP